MKTILLINPPLSEEYFNPEPPLQPLGLAYLGAALKAKNYIVEIIDGCCPLVKTTRASQSDFYSISDIVNRSLEKDYLFIGLSTVTMNYKNAIEIADRIKRENSKATIVFGGHHASYFHEHLLRDFISIDVIVRSEGEETITNLADSLNNNRKLSDVQGISYRDGSEIKINNSRPLINNLDMLPLPARELLPPITYYRSMFVDDLGEYRYIYSISSSRGCPNACSFCTIPGFYRKTIGPRWRCRSAENIISEIDYLQNDFNANLVMFIDDNFMVDPKRVLTIASLLQQRSEIIPFGFCASVDQLKDKKYILPVLKSAGCIDIEIGIENASKHVLKRYHKKQSVQQSKEVLDNLFSNNIKVALDYIMFEPEITPEELCENVTFIEENDLTESAYTRLFTKLLLYPMASIVNQKEYKKLTQMVGFTYELVPYEFKNDVTRYIYYTLSSFRKTFGPNIANGLDDIARMKMILHEKNDAIQNVKNNDLLKFIDMYLKRLSFIFMKCLVNHSCDYGIDEVYVEELIDRARRMIIDVNQSLSNIHSQIS